MTFKGGSFVEDDLKKYWRIPGKDIIKYVPFKLEPGAELIKELGWGEYPVAWR